MYLSETENRFSASLGRYDEPFKEILRSLDREKFAERLWKKDASLWKSDPEIQKKIKNRLGWLTVTKAMAEEAEALMAFSESVRNAGFIHVVLLGMGGSSLCPEVLRETYGVKAGYPDLIVLDSTDPAMILNTERRLDLAKTLFILASKSGTTIEMLSLYRHFHEKILAMKKNTSGDHFIAITDPETPLERLAHGEKFRNVFINPADIGGRFSALSYFGLVPGALIGLDLKAFLGRAEEMMMQSDSGVPAPSHPGILLGAALGGLGLAGRDKVTLIPAKAISRFGVWAEQLIAESTGKEGKGLVPVEGETVGDPRVYSDDRLFVCLGLDSSPDKELDQKVQVLQKAGHPVVRIRLRDTLDLAAEFFRWEIATAVAGAVLGINPFDEPNVSESKGNTSKALEIFREKGKLEIPKPVLEENGISISGNVKPGKPVSLKETIDGFLNQSRPNDYVVLMAYVEQSRSHEALLQELRHAIRDRFRIATTLGYGPRFLHSTGQLHKGGAGNGLYLQITADDPEDLRIPGGTYGFGVLKRAQALGDFHSLMGKGLRVMEIRLGSHIEKGLKKLLQAMKDTY
jgi:transaldolase / glucose-6-phosphate isomerase